MEIQHWKPWDWFNNEENKEHRNLPSGKDYGSMLHRMQEDMEQMFNNMMNTLSLRSGYESSMPLKGPWTPLTLKPSVDIVEHKDSYKITLEAPGVSQEDIKLEVSDHSLIISGEKQIDREERDDEGSNWHRIERAYGAFNRSLDLPEDADAENIKAVYDKGVLSITLPKKEQKSRKSRTVEIKQAA
jgi:HSP20 family protein